MKKIIEDNYQSIVDRGFIDSLTTDYDFFDKINEEFEELKDARFRFDLSNFKEEIADIIMVCLNLARHHNFDIEQEIKNKIEINKQRAKDGR
jgi:NTP pyrophosphatase (non-canonical NTP hydrolase)